MLYNLKEYHRPAALDEALALLRRTNVKTAALGGGTDLVGTGSADIEAVVDLADLGLDTISQQDHRLRIGATVRLQTLVEELPDEAGGLIAGAAKRTAGWHIRNQATIGGTLASGKIHTPLSVVLSSLDAHLEITEEDKLVRWTGIVPEILVGQLITAVVIDLSPVDRGTAYEQVGRTPADQPIVSAAAVVTPVDDEFDARVVIGGLTRSGLIGFNSTLNADPAPEDIADLFDLKDTNDVISDHLGSADYRISVAEELGRRTLTQAFASLGLELEG